MIHSCQVTELEQKTFDWDWELGGFMGSRRGSGWVDRESYWRDFQLASHVKYPGRPLRQRCIFTIDQLPWLLKLRKKVPT